MRVWGLRAVSVQSLQSPTGVFSFPSNERGRGRSFLPREGKCVDLMGRCGDMGHMLGEGYPFTSTQVHSSPWLRAKQGPRHQPIFRTQSCRRAGRCRRPGCMVPTLFPQHLWNTFCVAGTGLCAWGGDL